MLFSLARFAEDNANVETISWFILKASTGSSIFNVFTWIDTVIVRSALHVAAALRGTGHRLALTASHTHDFSCEWPPAPGTFGGRKVAVSPGTATCCRPCSRCVSPWVSLQWPPSALGLNAAALISAVIFRVTRSSYFGPIGNVQTGRVVWIEEPHGALLQTRRLRGQGIRLGCDAKKLSRKTKVQV